MSLSATIAKQITALLTGTGTGAHFGNPSWPLSLPKFLNAVLASGSGADQVQFIFAAQYNVAAAGTKIIDLYDLAIDGGADGIDPVGGSYALASVKYLGIQCQGNAQYYPVSAAVLGDAGGTGYAIGDILVLDNTGATYSTQAQLSVTGVAAGVITTVSILNAGIYSVKPTTTVNNHVVAATGIGSGAHITLTMSATTLTDAQIAAGVSIFTAADYLTIGDNGTTPWTKPFDISIAGAAHPTVKLGSGTANCPGTWEIQDGSGTLLTVADAANNLLKIKNNGANNMTFIVILLGS